MQKLRIGMFRHFTVQKISEARMVFHSGDSIGSYEIIEY